MHLEVLTVRCAGRQHTLQFIYCQGLSRALIRRVLAAKRQVNESDIDEILEFYTANESLKNVGG
ncbi:MAG: hypothetical protein NWQ28_13170 [Nodularia sp. (in: cyanobacteria)]|nr:hypothetical protein [Nodularia sp. (in: cyanobacteria)]